MGYIRIVSGALEAHRCTHLPIERYHNRVNKISISGWEMPDVECNVPLET